MSVARFISDQRTFYQVPHMRVCALLGVSLSWFYKWIKRARSPGAARGLYTDRDWRREAVDHAVKVAFLKRDRRYGSPRLHADLRDEQWVVSEKTVAASMRRQGLIARNTRRNKGITKQDRNAAPFPDLVQRNFTASVPDAKWVGDMTEIATGAGTLYLATVIDLFSRRLIGVATSLHPDANLACAAMTMAVTTRGGRTEIWRDKEEEKVIFHTDRGSTYTAGDFSKLCIKLGVRQSMGRVGSCFDNAAAESFFSSMEWEVLSRHQFDTPDRARAVVLDWCYDFYNHQRRHSTIGLVPPIRFEENALLDQKAA